MADSTRSSGAPTTAPVDPLADTRAQVLFELFEREVRAMGLELTAERLRGLWWDARSRWVHGEAER